MVVEMRDIPHESEIQILNTFTSKVHGDSSIAKRRLQNTTISTRYIEGDHRPPSDPTLPKGPVGRILTRIINRVAKRLSYRPKTKRKFYGNWTMEAGDGGTIPYKIGQNYGINARRPTKSFVKSRPRPVPIHPKRGGTPRWMGDINGSFVSKKYPLANNNHHIDDVTKGIYRLKDREPSEFFHRKKWVILARCLSKNTTKISEI